MGSAATYRISRYRPTLGCTPLYPCIGALRSGGLPSPLTRGVNDDETIYRSHLGTLKRNTQASVPVNALSADQKVGSSESENPQPRGRKRKAASGAEFAQPANSTSNQ